MLRVRTVVALPTLFLLLLAALGAQQSVSDETEPIATRLSFTINGQVRGLYPGHTQPATLTIRNRDDRRVVVNRVVVRTTKTDTWGCRPSTVTSNGWAGRRSIPEGGSVKVRVRFRMRQTAPAACQGARYTFRYTGWGNPR